MAALAAALPLQRLERAVLAAPISEREQTAAALLLGTGGFLALPYPSFLPTAEHLRDRWLAHGDGSSLDRAAWETARVRPANHPARRLLALAALLANGGAAAGLIATCLAPLIHYPDEPRMIVRALRQTLRPPSRFLPDHRTPIGADRAGEIAVNAVIPQYAA